MTPDLSAHVTSFYRERVAQRAARLEFVASILPQVHALSHALAEAGQPALRELLDEHQDLRNAAGTDEAWPAAVEACISRRLQQLDAAVCKLVADAVLESSRF